VPEVFAKACLGRQFPIVGEMVVPLSWVQFVVRSLLVADVEPYMVTHACWNQVPT
jgi:hypothetical protein